MVPRIQQSNLRALSFSGVSRENAKYISLSLFIFLYFFLFLFLFLFVGLFFMGFFFFHSFLKKRITTHCCF